MSQSDFWSKKVPLFKNCLLTRYPFLLIPPPASIFYYKNYYKKLESLLYEHGYPVEILKMPFSNSTQRQNFLKFTIENRFKNKPLHLVLDESNFSIFKEILTHIHPMSTVTIITPHDNLSVAPTLKPSVFYFQFKSEDKASLAYKLHSWWLNLNKEKATSYDLIMNEFSITQAKDFIKHAEKIAEEDYLTE